MSELEHTERSAEDRLADAVQGLRSEVSALATAIRELVEVVSKDADQAA